MSSSEPDLSFQSFGLSPLLIKSLNEIGYKKSSPIQSAAIPVLLKGSDLVGREPNGAGKTDQKKPVPVVHRKKVTKSKKRVRKKAVAKG
tara:strand:- start:1939 stop:2205 length:267 start_codon:yes stop_codon:yes gene_type:complete